jgi:hypothetical protein
MKPKLSEIKKGLEDLVIEGIPEEGFIVNSFKFSIPSYMEEFFDSVADDISIFDIYLDAWLSRRIQAIFVIAYRDHFSVEKKKRSFNEHKDDFGDQGYTKYPIIHLSFNIYFERINLPISSLKKIEENKHLFKDFGINDSYVSLYYTIKDFDFDFMFIRDLI